MLKEFLGLRLNVFIKIKSSWIIIELILQLYQHSVLIKPVFAHVSLMRNSHVIVSRDAFPLGNLNKDIVKMN